MPKYKPEENFCKIEKSRNTDFSRKWHKAGLQILGENSLSKIYPRELHQKSLLKELRKKCLTNMMFLNWTRSRDD